MMSQRSVASLLACASPALPRARCQRPDRDTYRPTNVVDRVYCLVQTANSWLRGPCRRCLQCMQTRS